MKAISQHHDTHNLPDLRSLFAGAERDERICPAHGAYIATIIPVGGNRVASQCPVCLDADGRRRVEAEEDLRRAAIQRRRAEENTAILRESNIPPRFADRTLDNFVATTAGQKNALAVARDYADRFDEALRTGRSLIFFGEKGTGKTHLAIGIAQAVMATGKTVAFSTLMDAIGQVRQTYGKNSTTTDREVIRRFAEPHLTILDEIGVQMGTNAEQVTLSEMMNARYLQMRPTIVLSNYDLPTIRRFMGERVFDRLRENGGLAVPFDWPSHRGERAAG